MTASITCPVCTRTSYNPNDVREGFCGFCHAWTSRPDLADPATGAPMTEPYPTDDAGSLNPEAVRRALWRAAEPFPGDWPTGDATIAEITLPAGVSALATVEALMDAAPLTAPQAQGDVMVLPWPASTAPGWRGQEIDACTPMTLAGVAVDPAESHLLLPERIGPEPIGWHPTGKGYTLGTLYVPPGAAARLSHHEHADLLIGPGVYVIRQQRAYTGPGRTNPRHRPAPDTTPAGD